LPGVSSSIAFFPGLQLGIGLLSNVQGKAPVNKDILWKIVDAVIASEVKTSDVESSNVAAIRVEGRTKTHTMAVTKLPMSTLYRSSRIDISAFAGTYADPGYGSITFCAPYTFDQQLSSSLGRSHCTVVLAAFKKFNDTRLDTLYGFWNRIDTNAFRLVRVPEDGAEQWGNNTFSFRATDLHPHGYGKNTSAFEADDLQSYTNPEAGYGRMVFQVTKADEKVVIEGFGWEGTVDYGVVPERQKKGKTIQERADVWFRKVSS
jgi:hypothetical protein